MWVVRAVRLEDVEPLAALIRLATQGLTSLQLDRDRLLDRIEQSVFAFARTSPTPWGEPYVLVMADDASGEIVGTSTVFAKTGGYQPFYTYQIVTTEQRCDSLGVRRRHRRLELLRIHDGPTEIGSLFLRKRVRGQGRGWWLSMARFVLIATRPHRFADRVIAEMRGHAKPDGTVPFWEALAAHFIPVDFAVADTLSTVNKQFIEELMPHHPIPLELLPPEVRESLGRVHPETEPALKMLRGEGFRQVDQVDIFDGGPVVSCETHRIAAVRRTRAVTVTEITDDLGKDPAGPGRGVSGVVPPENEPGFGPVILASDRGGFCCVMTHVEEPEPGRVRIRTRDARILGLETGCPASLLSRSR